jgi:hypothetical protein
VKPCYASACEINFRSVDENITIFSYLRYVSFKISWNFPVLSKFRCQDSSLCCAKERTGRAVTLVADILQALGCNSGKQQTIADTGCRGLINSLWNGRIYSWNSPLPLCPISPISVNYRISSRGTLAHQLIGILKWEWINIPLSYPVRVPTFSRVKEFVVMVLLILCAENWLNFHDTKAKRGQS